jgi:erythromycin esterase
MRFARIVKCDTPKGLLMKTHFGYRTLLSLAFAFLSYPSFSQTLLNLGFERSFNNKPTGWYIGGEAFDSKLDSLVVHSGKTSLRMHYTGGPGFAVATQVFPLEMARGKKIRFSGYIKSDSINRGFAGLWWRVDGKNRILAFDNMQQRGAKGTTPWQRYDIDLPVDSAAININFGVLLSGNGTAWFDDLHIELDDQPFVDTLIAVSITPEQTMWIKSHSVQLKTSKAGSGFDDLRALKNLIGDARIVALGEATHGTREFFQMKHRITEYLATEMGFTIFAIEANMPEAYRVNDYVLGGDGDPKELLKGMYFWTWNTQEVLDMIEWMRTFNRSGKGKIQFLGFDMQTPDVALNIVSDYVRGADPGYSPMLDSLKGGVDSIMHVMRRGQKPDASMQAVAGLCDSVLNHLVKSRTSQDGTSPATGLDWTIQNATVVGQAVRQALKGNSPSASAFRDSCMAANVTWIVDHAPSKCCIVLWAHNGHIAKHKEWMGSHLAARYGADYLAVGQTCYAGLYTAVAPGKGLRSDNLIAPPMPGSFEDFCHSTGRPQFVLDVRNPGAGDKGSAWLTRPVQMRSIGALAMDHQQYETRISEDYDLVIYFENTEASKSFGPTRPTK